MSALAALSGKALRPSRFNLVIPLAGVAEQLVFNTFRGSSALVSPSVGQSLSSCLPQAGEDRVIFRSFNAQNNGQSPITIVNSDAFTEHTMHLLTSLGILLDSNQEEHEAIESLLSNLWDPPVLKLTLSYTASCQMACKYCFQEGRDLSRRHSPMLRESTISWVEQYLDRHPHISTIHLGLFGGEPLTDIKQADKYIEHLHHLAQSRDLKLSISLTTNGLNLRPQIIKRWVKKGLTYIRVTLDGPQFIHDQRRPLHSGGGSFYQILDGLCSIKDISDIGIGVSTNLDAQNVQHLSGLLAILQDCHLEDHIEILLEPTFPSTKQASEHRSQCRDDLTPRHVASLIQLALEQVIEHGFKTPIIPGLCTPCNFIQGNSFVIDWSGVLFRCTFTMLDPQMAVGSVENGLTGNNDKLLAARNAIHHCLERRCAYLPICGGGCRYWTWCQTENWHALYCPLELWDQTLPLSLAHAFNLQALHADSKSTAEMPPVRSTTH